MYNARNGLKLVDILDRLHIMCVKDEIMCNKSIDV